MADCINWSKDNASCQTAKLCDLGLVGRTNFMVMTFGRVQPGHGKERGRHRYLDAQQWTESEG